MALVETKTYSPNDSILYTADHKVTLPVMVSNSGISAGSDGKKVVPAGTILGGALADVSAGAVAADGISVAAEGILLNDVDVTENAEVGTLLIQGVVDESKLTVKPTPIQKAQLPQITFVNGGDDDDIDFLLSKGSFTAVNITVSNTGVVADADSKKIRKAGTVLGGALADPETGAVAASTAATDNSNNPTPAEGILLYDVDVTDGDAPGVLLVQGVVDESKLSGAVNAYNRSTMPGIVFVGTYSA